MKRGGIAAALIGASLLLSLSGCALGWAAAGAAAGGLYTDWQTVDTDGSKILAADAGLKKDLCAKWNPALHNAVWNARVQTYCANIPTTVIGAVETTIKVIHAKPAQQQAALPPVAEPPQAPPPPTGAPSEVPWYITWAAGAVGVVLVGTAGYTALTTQPKPKRA